MSTGQCVTCNDLLGRNLQPGLRVAPIAPTDASVPGARAQSTCPPRALSTVIGCAASLLETAVNHHTGIVICVAITAAVLVAATSRAWRDGPCAALRSIRSAATNRTSHVLIGVFTHAGAPAELCTASTPLSVAAAVVFVALRPRRQTACAQTVFTRNGSW